MHFSSRGEQLLLGENSFQQLLALEKKRSERSGHPILLMRLAVRDTGDRQACEELLSLLSGALFAITRETDLKGWYVNQLILGVIYTEMGNADFQEARDTILRKVEDTLGDLLSDDQRRQVEISFESFPGEQAHQLSPDLAGGLQLYGSKAATGASPANPIHLVSAFLKHRGLLLLGDGLLVALAGFIGAWMRYGTPAAIVAATPEIWLITFCQVVAALFLCGLYTTGRFSRQRETLFRTALAVGLAALFGAVPAHWAPSWLPGQPIPAFEGAFLWVLLAGFRIVHGRLFFPVPTRLPALVLGNGNLGRNVCRLLNTTVSPYDVRGCLVDGPVGENAGNQTPPILGGLDRLGETATALGIRTLIVALPRRRSRQNLRRILEARFNGMEVVDLPDLYERLTGRVPVQYIEDRWLLFANGFSLLSQTAVQRIKRLTDVTVAGFALLVTLPLAGLTALAVRLDSVGPVFYREPRTGRGGRLFHVWNFRTMRAPGTAEANVPARPGEPGMTRAGRWLRRFHLDQLPQLWNVFKGEMSLVGPSPERPELARELDRQIPYYSVRHTVRPGITGWAQIKYPYGASFEDVCRRLEYDLYYIKNRSLFLDLKILGRTLWGVKREAVRREA